MILALAAFAHAADEEAERKERLELMKRQAADYVVARAGANPSPLTLHGEPLLRFSNPVGGVPDGIAVMWKDGQRPAVFAQVFQTKEGLWIHECQSISTDALTMRLADAVKWQPASRPDESHLHDAPTAAETPAKRLLQMKAIAARFTASDDFKISSRDRETTRHQLRLLPTPVYRYQDEASQVVDGAVFAFVHGTDPEAFLVLECRG